VVVVMMMMMLIIIFHVLDSYRLTYVHYKVAYTYCLLCLKILTLNIQE